MDTKKWMSYIDDNKKLYEITMPGTHDTGTWTLIDGPAKCQIDSLDKQLELGIRFIDIRLKPSGNDIDPDTLMVWHGSYSTGLEFNSDIVAKCSAFLKDNPSETILMSIKDESQSYPRPDVFYKKVKETITLWKNLFYTEDKIPQLKDAKGKIVLLRRFPLSGGENIGINLYDEWPNGNKINKWTNSGGSFYIQDEYTYFTIIENKYYNYVRPTLDAAVNGAYNDYLFLNFASCTGRLWPMDISNIINEKILEHINDPGKGRYGIIPMDAPSTEVINALIGCNISTINTAGTFSTPETQVASGAN